MVSLCGLLTRHVRANSTAMDKDLSTIAVIRAKREICEAVD